MSSVFPTTGAAHIAGTLTGNVSTNPDFIGWGTGAGVSSVADTALFSEGVETRALAARSNPSPSVASWTGNLVALQAVTITNAGVFSDVVGGSLIIKTDFPGIVLAPGAAIQFVFSLSIS